MKRRCGSSRYGKRLFIHATSVLLAAAWALPCRAGEPSQGDVVLSLGRSIPSNGQHTNRSGPVILRWRTARSSPSPSNRSASNRSASGRTATPDRSSSRPTATVLQPVQPVSFGVAESATRRSSPVSPPPAHRGQPIRMSLVVQAAAEEPVVENRSASSHSQSRLVRLNPPVVEPTVTERDSLQSVPVLTPPASTVPTRRSTSSRTPSRTPTAPAPPKPSRWQRAGRAQGAGEVETPAARIARREAILRQQPEPEGDRRSPPPLNRYSPERCEQFFEDVAVDRNRLYDNVISRVVLDITPTKPAQLRDPAEGKTRTWRDRSGSVLAVGKLVDFKNGRVFVERSDQTTKEIEYGRLSNADMCYVNSIWQVPLEFVLTDEQLIERNWLPMTLAWKASEVCNKPLYFEEPQLERYGHTFNPYFQPVVSGAHFFLNIAVLPYKMGIHPIHECRYDLGYYRPGSCAPWMVPPVPLSVRGGLIEAGVILGGVYALP